MRNITCVIICLLIYTTQVFSKIRFGEDLSLPVENDRVYVDLSQHVLVAGQVLNFKAYVCNPGCQNNISPSKILYYEIINNSNQKVHTWRSNIESGISSGTLSIPDSISGGLYTLRAFTNWMRNFSTSDFFATPVIITHLTDHNLIKLDYPASCARFLNVSTNSDSINIFNTNSNNSEPKEDYISIETSKNTYKVNEKVRIILSSNIAGDDIMNLSVTVLENTQLEKFIKTSSITDFLQMNSSASQENKLKNDKEYKYPIESEGYLLTGSVIDEINKQPVKNIPVYLSKIDSIVQFRYFETDEEGRFGFLLNHDYDNHQLVMQTNLDGDNSLKWTIDDKWNNVDPLSLTSAYILSDEEELELDNIRKTELARKIFEKGNQKLMQIQNAPANSFYFNPDYMVKPSDYEELSDFNDISENILPLVRFKKNRKGYSFYLILDEMLRDPGYPPGLFLNGMPFFNLDYISALNTNDIDHVDVCTHPIMYGDHIFYGIVSIFTNSMDINKMIFNNPFYKAENKVIKDAGTNNCLLINRQMLFFTPCIYWNPDIEIKGNDSKIIEFDIPMIQTEYLVRINGIKSDGAPFSKSINLKIEE